MIFNKRHTGIPVNVWGQRDFCRKLQVALPCFITSDDTEYRMFPSHWNLPDFTLEFFTFDVETIVLGVVFALLSANAARFIRNIFFLGLLIGGFNYYQSPFFFNDLEYAGQIIILRTFEIIQIALPCFVLLMIFRTIKANKQRTQASSSRVAPHRGAVVEAPKRSTHASSPRSGSNERAQTPTTQKAKPKWRFDEEDSDSSPGSKKAGEESYVFSFDKEELDFDNDMSLKNEADSQNDAFSLDEQLLHHNAKSNHTHYSRESRQQTPATPPAEEPLFSLDGQYGHLNHTSPAPAASQQQTTRQQQTTAKQQQGFRGFATDKDAWEALRSK